MKPHLLLILALVFVVACAPEEAAFEGLEVHDESVEVSSIEPKEEESEEKEEVKTFPLVERDNGKGIFAEKGVLQEGQERVNEPKIYPEFDENGQISLSDEEWKERLTGHEFRILWRSWTEPPFTGDLLENKKKGTYVTAGCGIPVFSSEAKYDSGTGWPSFWEPLNNENIILREDYLLGYKRIEILSSCGEHLGHVFNDGPEPTGLRYCINSAALDFIEEE